MESGVLTGLETEDVSLVWFEPERQVVVTEIECGLPGAFTVESVVRTGLEVERVVLEALKVEVEVAPAVTVVKCVVHPTVQVGQAPFSVIVLAFSHPHTFSGTVTVLVKSHGNCLGPVHVGAAHCFGASVMVAVKQAVAVLMED